MSSVPGEQHPVTFRPALFLRLFQLFSLPEIASKLNDLPHDPPPRCCFFQCGDRRVHCTLLLHYGDDACFPFLEHPPQAAIVQNRYLLEATVHAIPH